MTNRTLYKFFSNTHSHQCARAHVQKWTVDLCRTDSDGDGKTNGEELGDPECTWQPGDIPEFTSGLSHPGKSDIMLNRSFELDIILN